MTLRGQFFATLYTRTETFWDTKRKEEEMVA